MKQKLTDNDARRGIKCPSGYRPVMRGEVEKGDLLWSKVDEWEPAVGGEIGSPVTSFKAVARKHDQK